MPKMTHIGVLEGNDARTPVNFRAVVNIRETKLYWVTEHGGKYSKKRKGRGVGDWPMYTLKLETVRPIEA